MTYYQEIHQALKEAQKNGLVMLGQINSYRFPDFPLEDFPVCESLMNAVGVGIALTGKKVIVSHDRMDFVTCGIDPIINFAQIREKTGPLPLTIRVIVGYGKNQGPQHAKDLSYLFQGIKTYDPKPGESGGMLKECLESGELSVFVERRILYDS